MKLGPFASIALFLLSACALPALAANSPCSGKKGGIAGCDGDIFLCNDGSISASKRSCAAYFGNAGGAAEQPAVQRLRGTPDGCACGSGTFCTGPRGGVYCLTPGGKKSYRRK
ncbi:hypothetical protein ABZR71_00025 [Pseudomonas paraeruginosa]|uniref:Lipoprotein, putative n=1 Tax=Pseudomonas paraeruginosa (strain DSM 24068 / PA7) TaxID=381754 RepID=A6V261_PSEP7|nr:MULTISPECIES: hypothetical protein [Pseudomonas aeruginosa group]VTS34275.1 Uncharacterised protein [Streptococcus dysgalactiae subsp. equisimilis]ABR84622.1 lipoprotein, putative [Pseudomonas aeruginosa PA7]AVR66943.1 hypothetical protein B7D75_08185 [Pseudomonas paraeruginosa]KPD30216.1 hypothetical protein AN920_08515 [Pseudomonas paraeruginosa]KQB30673.1 hypothetical protein AOA77_19280 [Pseudomonas paraeruginosa]